MAEMSRMERPTSPAWIAVAWMLVGLPLSWGVYRSALNAVKLFQAPAAIVAAPAVPVPATSAPRARP